MTEDEQIRRILIYEIIRLGYIVVRDTCLYTRGLQNIRIMFIHDNPVLKFEYMGSHLKPGFNEYHEIPMKIILEGKSREFISRLHNEFSKKVSNHKKVQFTMVRINKAMIAEERILSAVSDIKNIKDRKGTASDDAVRVILKKWWIPSDSRIANSLKWYSHVTAPDMAVTVIANHLVEISSIENSCSRYDIIHEVPSNGFNLPEGAGNILGKEVWIPLLVRGRSDEINIVTARVDQICLYASGEYYNVNVTHIHGESPHLFKHLPEHAIFLNKADCTEALKGKFINLDII